MQSYFAAYILITSNPKNSFIRTFVVGTKLFGLPRLNCTLFGSHQIQLSLSIPNAIYPDPSHSGHFVQGTNFYSCFLPHLSESPTIRNRKPHLGTNCCDSFNIPEIKSGTEYF